MTHLVLDAPAPGSSTAPRVLGRGLPDPGSTLSCPLAHFQRETGRRLADPATRSFVLAWSDALPDDRRDGIILPLLERLDRERLPDDLRFVATLLRWLVGDACLRWCDAALAAPVRGGKPGSHLRKLRPLLADFSPSFPVLPPATHLSASLNPALKLASLACEEVRNDSRGMARAAGADTDLTSEARYAAWDATWPIAWSALRAEGWDGLRYLFRARAERHLPRRPDAEALVEACELALGIASRLVTLVACAHAWRPVADVVKVTRGQQLAWVTERLGLEVEALQLNQAAVSAAESHAALALRDVNNLNQESLRGLLVRRPGGESPHTTGTTDAT